MSLIRVLVFKPIRKFTLKRKCTQMWSERQAAFVTQMVTFSTEFMWEGFPIILRSVVMASVWPHVFKTFT